MITKHPKAPYEDFFLFKEDIIDIGKKIKEHIRHRNCIISENNSFDRIIELYSVYKKFQDLKDIDIKSIKVKLKKAMKSDKKFYVDGAILDRLIVSSLLEKEYKMCISLESDIDELKKDTYNIAIDSLSNCDDRDIKKIAENSNPFAIDFKSVDKISENYKVDHFLMYNQGIISYNNKGNRPLNINYDLIKQYSDGVEKEEFLKIAQIAQAKKDLEIAAKDYQEKQKNFKNKVRPILKKPEYPRHPQTSRSVHFL